MNPRRPPDAPVPAIEVNDLTVASQEQPGLWDVDLLVPSPGVGPLPLGLQ